MSNPIARLALALALVCACRGARPDRPEGAPLPSAITTLPLFDPDRLVKRPPPPPSTAPLTVLEVGPQGQQEGVAAIFVRFDRPVAPLDLASADPALQSLLRINPPIPGRARWLAPDHLVFEPAAPLTAATRYTVELAPTTRGLGGQALTAGRTWSFETPRPRVNVASLYDDQADHPARDPVFLELDQPSTPAELLAHLRATARPRAGGPALPVALTVRSSTAAELEQGWPWRPHERDRMYTISAATGWPLSSTIELELRAGLRGSVGPLPLDTPWALRFTTPEPQALLSTTCTAQLPCGREPIVLRFRNPLAPDQLASFTVTPRPAELEIHPWDDREVAISGVFLPDRTYTVRVAPGLADVHGSALPALTRRAHFVQRPDLDLADRSGVLTPAQPHIGVEAHALRSVIVTVGVYSEAETAALARLDADDPEALAALPRPARTAVHTVELTPRGATAWAAHALDLAALTGARPLHGVVFVEVAPGARVPGAAARNPPAPVRGLYRVTDLALAAHASLPATEVQVVHLSSGTAAAGVELCRLGPKLDDPTCHPLGVTDADGLLRIPELPLPTLVRPDLDEQELLAGEDPPEYQRLRLVASDPRTGDRAHLELDAAPRLPHDRDRSDTRLRRGERVIGHLVRERGVYRPGERVHLVGWASVETPYTRSNLAPLPRGTPVHFTLLAEQRHVVARAHTRSSADGKFWATLTIPDDAPLTYYRATATVAGESLDADLRVADYRVPELDVTLTARDRDLLLGRPAVLDLRADYYFGGPVPLTRVTRDVVCVPLRYRPPGLDAAWRVGPEEWSDLLRKITGKSVEVPAAAADATGRRRIVAPLTVGERQLAHRCTISALAEDASLQGVGAEATVTVHPAPIYLAVRPPRDARAGERAQIDLRALTRDGDRTAAPPIRVDLERRWQEPIYREVDGVRVVDHHEERRAALPPCTVDLTATGPDAACTLTPREPGTYHLAAHTRVDEREARTTTTFSVYPPRDAPPAPQRHRERSPQLELHIPEHGELRPGERVRITLAGPWPYAEGALVLARAGLRERLPFALKDGQAAIDLLVDDTWTPELHLFAHVVVPATPTRLTEIHRAEGMVHVGSEHRRLRVAVAAPREAGPGESIDLAVTVRDAADRPTAARVALWAVDEAVLALNDETTPDLLAMFIPRRHAELDARDDLRAQIFPYTPRTADPWLRGHTFGRRTTRAPQARVGHAMVDGGTLSALPRQRYATTPVFLADVAVDRSGAARLTATMPDNLTTFRITAIASAGLAAGGPAPARFGGGEARTVVTAPLVVRAAAPRQLRPGDVAEVAAIVENRGASAGRLVVAADLVDATGPSGHVLELLSQKPVRVDLPAGGQARAVFKVRARAPGPGARLELRARLLPAGARRRDAVTDAVRVPLPVEAEATLTERAALYGELADARAIEIPVQLPRGALAGHGGLQLRASASLLAGLADAATALIEYPHGCAEQTASRLLPAIALPGLGVELPAGHVEAALARLKTMQRSAGFAYWPDASSIHPYATAYVTWALQRAAAAGLPVPGDMLERALDGLADTAAAADLAGLPAPLRRDAAVPLALALQALADAGRDVKAPAAALFAHRGELPLFARALLLMALHRDDPRQPAVTALTDELIAGLDDGPAEARTRPPPGGDLERYFDSEARTDAMVLLALLQVQPDHPLITRLARGLLARRRGGAWRNTQENAYALVALAAFARHHEPAAPDLQAHAWLAGAEVLAADLRGRDAAPAVATAAMTDLLAMTEETGGLLPVVLQRQGEGRLYWRLGVTWAPSARDLPARDQGLALTRRLRDHAGPLRDVLPAGAPIALDLQLVNRRRTPHVVVDIPLPAGLEAVQFDLGHGRRAAAPLTGEPGGWIDHEELRRDRVVLFADELPPGTHHHTVHLRATTRGRFDFPPARAEAMYTPELYGRSTGATVEVQ